jgi:hypothetical protein
MKVSVTCVLAVLLTSIVAQAGGEPLGTNFTYQGELTAFGEPANGSFDFTFDIFDQLDGGAPLAAQVFRDDVVVNDGVFTVELDFGSNPFSGDKLWLEIGVREGTSTGLYAELAPRHPVTASPYALVAMKVVPDSITATEIASGAVGTNEINTAEVQRRVVGSCSPGTYITAIAGTGTVTCGVDDDTGLAPTGHNHDGHTHVGSDITSAIDLGHYDAYGGLSNDGRLDNNSGSDLLTRTQMDGRFSFDGHNHLGGSGMFVDPTSCQRGLSGSAPYVDTIVHHRPANGAGPGITVPPTSAAGDYYFYCPVPELHSPFGSVSVTGGKFGFVDVGPSCLVSVELKYQEEFANGSLGSLGIGYSGTSSVDYASTPGSGTKNITSSTHVVTSSQMLFVEVNIKRDSTSIGDCRFTGIRVNYTLSP